MHLLWHQLKKDLLRTRLLVGLWLFFSLLRFALAAVNVRPDDMAWQTAITLLSPLSTLLGSLLVMILVPVLIQQEPLVGTTTFWLTRPISRRLLLAEKSFFLLGLILLPLFIQSIVFLADGVTLRDTVVAMPEFIIGQASWFLVVAMIAVLTPGIGRFIIGCVIYLGVDLLGTYVFSILGIFSGRLFNVSPSLTASRALVSSLLLIACGVAVVLIQYFWRRYGWALALVIFALVASTVAGQFWPWNFLKPAPVLVQDGAFRPDGITLHLDGNTNANDQGSLRGGEPDKQITGPVATPGLPPGYLLHVDKCDADLRTAAGERIPVLPMNNPFFSFNQPDETEMEPALGGVPIVNAQRFGASFWNFFNVSSATFHRYGAVPSRLSAQFHLVASKYVVIAELPIQKGAHFERGSRRERITDVLHQDGGVTLLLDTQDVRLNYALRPDQDTINSQPDGGAVYVLLNRKTHEALREKQNIYFNGLSFSGSGGLTHQPRRIAFGPENNSGNDWTFPHLDDAWLHDAVLVRLELQPVAEFTKTLDVPSFRLDGQYNSPGRNFEPYTPDLDTLAKIKLPPDATRSQVRDYIAAILAASQGATGVIDEHDPQVGMLEQVGAENVDLLAAAARDTHNYYLNRAIDHLAQPDQKALIIADLPTNVDLISTVVHHGWQTDARDVLIAGLDANKGDPNIPRTGNQPFPYIGQEWIQAVAGLKDPAIYPALHDYFVNHADVFTYRTLAALPGFDSAGALRDAWAKTQSGTGRDMWRVGNLLPLAAQAGFPDVPATLLKLLSDRSQRFPYPRQEARKIAHLDTPAVGQTDDELAAWFKANGAKLVFDPARKKYVFPATPPPAATNSAASVPVAPPTPPRDATTYRAMPVAPGQ